MKHIATGGRVLDMAESLDEVSPSTELIAPSVIKKGIEDASQGGGGSIAIPFLKDFVVDYTNKKVYWQGEELVYGIPQSLQAEFEKSPGLVFANLTPDASYTDGARILLTCQIVEDMWDIWEFHGTAPVYDGIVVVRGYDSTSDPGEIVVKLCPVA